MKHRRANGSAAIAAAAAMVLAGACATVPPASAPGPAEPHAVGLPALTARPTPLIRPPSLPPPPPTLDAVRQLVMLLNELIARRDFLGWREHLSPDYIQRFSDREYLRELSRAPVLRRSGVVLRDLDDFFRFVVLPSRYNTAVERIQQINPWEVRVYAATAKGPAILFHLTYANQAGWVVNPPFSGSVALPAE